ncbi:GNAT family N-acetyltransferase [Epibacterium sp. SM1969]|uniref:GNAT family N-acetyltransferase n=1 Tax=Tritonibacter aquimaris TaxID=2663379 RepID=A0A844AY83_9RHOB|nr:GNAT family N-acetyltransferase [Tritonibacter aquimaris]MQY42136.1 GNAT family N-acetyltransferase [Tritonibacter aquimaris]
MIQAPAIITTARLTLRKPQAGDLPAYEAYCASDRARFVGGPFNAVSAFNKFAAIIGHWTLRGFGRYVIEHGGAPIGHVGPMAMDRNEPPEMTWTLWSDEAEGQGFALEAARAVAQHFLIDAHWPEFIIRIEAENRKSRALAEGLGANLSDAAAPEWLPNAVTYMLREVSE